MSDFITFLFATIGFTATFFGVLFGTFWVLDKISKAAQLRDERHKELVRKLEAIERMAGQKSSIG
jgi:hypothetical protein